MVTFKSNGDFKKTNKFLKGIVEELYLKELERYAKAGVDALSNATPVDSGETASSWGYRIVKEHGNYKIIWTNSNESNGIPIAILIQYGHSTRNGGYVEGRDFINPAIRPIFDQMAEEAWRGVVRL